MLLDHAGDGGVDHQRSDDQEDRRERHAQRRQLVRIPFRINEACIPAVVEHDPAALTKLFELFFCPSQLLFRLIILFLSFLQLLPALLKLAKALFIAGDAVQVLFPVVIPCVFRRFQRLRRDLQKLFPRIVAAIFVQPRHGDIHAAFNCPHELRIGKVDALRPVLFRKVFEDPFPASGNHILKIVQRHFKVLELYTPLFDLDLRFDKLIPIIIEQLFSIAELLRRSLQIALALSQLFPAIVEHLL